MYMKSKHVLVYVCSNICADRDILSKLLIINIKVLFKLQIFKIDFE